MAELLQGVGKEDHAKALEAGYANDKADMAAGRVTETPERLFSYRVRGTFVAQGSEVNRRAKE